MANSLQSLFDAIARASDEQELRSQVISKLSEYFAAERSGIFFFDKLWQFEKNIPRVVRLAFSLEHNPVLRYLVEHHAVVHEELLLSPGEWQVICPRFDHYHVMVGPVVGSGHLLGAIGLTRTRNAPAFNAQELADLSALCLHISTWRATLQLRSTLFNSLSTNPLTQREIQIAELVAQGLTNAEIGATLWITENSVKQALKRIFRKLDVSSRAEMVGRLSSNMKLI
ncbi:MAG: LuxR C-terminal-related transcriptional regulator [Nostoc sp. ChiSLP02]|nr:LuxR C-terminal-related transcriptional regulator [Nostoc sp. DedSLP05]MDZ8098797.1 LuxR C-terminal-related transcriptional regulator [Nostoc sp. DedSLP01]MDZ8183589.1 LuxR C-terminal-related transcriptional regulator [Nostoc sp. ChiSLP02]